MVVSAPGCHAAEGEPSSTVSAWRVAGPPGGGDGALQADRGLPCHAGMPRVWAYGHARLACTMAAFKVLVQWHGCQPHAAGFVPLSQAEFSL
jgi:hypothetical protein